MEEDIQNYSPTVMFRGTPCIYNTLQTNQEEKVQFNLHNCDDFVTPLLVYV